MTERGGVSAYFNIIPISARVWQALGLKKAVRLMNERRLPPVLFYRHFALSHNQNHPPSSSPATVSV